MLVLYIQEILKSITTQTTKMFLKENMLSLEVLKTNLNIPMTKFHPRTEENVKMSQFYLISILIKKSIKKIKMRSKQKNTNRLLVILNNN